jgi:hypothetical protein
LNKGPHKADLRERERESTDSSKSQPRQIWNSSTGGNPGEEDKEVEGQRESTHFMISVKRAKEA